MGRVVLPFESQPIGKRRLGQVRRISATMLCMEHLSVYGGTFKHFRSVPMGTAPKFSSEWQLAWILLAVGDTPSFRWYIANLKSVLAPESVGSHRRARPLFFYDPLSGFL